MNKMVKTLLPVVCVLTLLLSCKTLDRTTPTSGMGTIEELRKQVPFTIIVPSYLPDDVSPYPVGILGPGKGPSSDNSVMVGFGYTKSGTDAKFIDIYEENCEVAFHPSRPSSIYLDIAGTQVLEQESELALASKSPSGSATMRGYFYAWSRDGINCKVTIYGYGQGEGRRVVESMIR